MCALLCLASFTQYNGCEVYLCCVYRHISVSFILVLSSIPLYGCTTFCLFIHLLMDI